MTSSELRRSLDSLALLERLIASQVGQGDVEFERLLDGYLDARRELATQFSKIAQHYLLQGDSLLETTRDRIEKRMAKRFGDRAFEKYLYVQGYSSVQPILLQYLAQHVGKPVRSSKLRVLTGDQIHTERRVRDLRDLGFDVEWKRIADDDQYILKSAEPDLDFASVSQLRRNVKGDKSLARSKRDVLLSDPRLALQ